MKKKVFIGIGAVLGVALLAGAVFVGVRMLNSNSTNGGPGGLLASLGLQGGGTASFAMSIEMTPAPELPTTRADIVGQVVSVKDNSIFVSEMSKGGTVSGGANVVIVGKAISGGAGPSTDSGDSPTPSGPITEVVVSKETLIYRDTSMDNVPKPTGSGSTTLSVQQVVTLVDISQIAQNYMVQVWGQKRGDRLIADTIVVMGAPVIMKSGAGQ
jgi:hypothetical protein